MCNYKCSIYSLCSDVKTNIHLELQFFVNKHTHIPAPENRPNLIRGGLL